MCSLQERKWTVSQECDVDVVTNGNQPQSIANDTWDECVVDNKSIKERQLEEMQDHEERKESIEMNVKAVSPLNVLTTRWLNNEISICDQPEYCCNEQTNTDTVNEHNPQNELDKVDEMQAKNYYEPNRRHT